MNELPRGTAVSAVLEGLKALRTSQTREDSGICWNLSNHLLDGDIYPGHCSQLSILVGELSTDWPGFSGVKKYPVSHPELAPMDAYGCDDLWDPATVYGANRRDLLEHLITKFEEMVSHV